MAKHAAPATDGKKPERNTPWSTAPARGKDLSALYGAPSHASRLEKESRELQEILPGPGHYFGPDSKGFSSTGPGSLSQTASAPSVTIARTGWDDWQKTLITRKHRGHTTAPDPGKYEVALSSLSQKGVSVARDKRFAKKAATTASPGPVYDVREQHCKTGSTDIVGNNALRFNNSERFRGDMSGINVGPGQYDRKDAAIKVDFSHGKSFGIGWKAYDKVIRPGWEQEGQGRAGPGVGPPMWEETDKLPNKHAIPRAKRFQKPQDAVPGPGAYTRSERDLSRLKSTISDTRNPRMTKFGKPTTKPRLRFNVLSQCRDGNWGYS